MKTNIYITILMAALLLCLQACGDNSSVPRETETTEVKGTITAPDGETPLSGATIFIPAENSNKITVKAKGTVSSTINAQDCKEPSESYSAYTCTEADGSFIFDIPATTDNVLLKIFKGIFSFEQTIESEHTPNWRPQERVLQFLDLNNSKYSNERFYLIFK